MIDFKALQAAATAAVELGENCIFPDEACTLLEEEMPSPEETEPAKPQTEALPPAEPSQSASAKPDWLLEVENVAAKRRALEATSPTEDEDDEARSTPASNPISTAPALQPIQSAVEAANDTVVARIPFNTKAIQAALSLFKADETGESESRTFTANRFFGKVTFTDIPPALLKTASDDDLAAKGMVAMAISRGWSPLRAEGSDTFKTHAFRHAVRMGVELMGYTPSQADLDALGHEGLAIPEWVCSNQIGPATEAANRTGGHRAPRSPSMTM